MKLQTLIIIFLAIALPVIIILSVYIELSVDTVVLRSKYDDALVNASHEAVTAYQINTGNDKYLTVADTKIRDIEAALKVFSSSLSTSFGITGSSRSRIMAYVPALAITLYDGYYIYTPTKDWESGNFSHELKPYVHYSKEYVKGNEVLTVNYSLDNYVAVYYKTSNHYISRAGYLEKLPGDEVEKNEILNSLGDEAARKYYTDAWEYTKWFNEIVKSDAKWKKILYIDGNNIPLPGYSSEFNSEKTEVIKTTLTNNLIQAMHVYSRNSDKDFKMPELTGEDWDLLLNNVCFVAFMQGMPVGTTTYNDYAIVASSENKEIANENLIYYINVNSDGTASGSYHRIWCPRLQAKDSDSIVRI